MSRSFFVIYIEKGIGCACVKQKSRCAVGELSGSGFVWRENGGGNGFTME